FAWIVDRWGWGAGRASLLVGCSAGWLAMELMSRWYERRRAAVAAGGWGWGTGPGRPPPRVVSWRRAAAGGAPRPPRARAAVVWLVCAAQVCAQIGAYTWPALLPRFLGDWRLTNSEAGWITSLFYASYTLSVPILVTLTDRVDPRRVYLTGVGLTVLSHGAFALVVGGPWGGAGARGLSGGGGGGADMTGLKLLAGRVGATLMSGAAAGPAARNRR